LGWSPVRSRELALQSRSRWPRKARTWRSPGSITSLRLNRSQLGFRKAGRRAHLIRADVARLADIEAMVTDTVRVLGAADILINNAGVYPRVKLLEMREADWDYVLDVNLKAGCFATIAFIKALMASAKGSGSVTNISSQAIRGAVRGVHYSASKGGVVSMTRAMALELAPYNIRVNAIAPGTTDTAQPRYGNTETELVEMARTIPLGGKMLTPEQIARTAVFLASEDANAITGQVVHVNSGTSNSCSAMPNGMGWLGYRWRRALDQARYITGPPALVVDDGATFVGPSRA
jgi:NAD(P)-dependent dehydrogenase (short-subunit alcohol dehydrogenase family)